jgi:hypothetical protein
MIAPTDDSITKTFECKGQFSTYGPTPRQFRISVTKTFIESCRIIHSFSSSPFIYKTIISLPSPIDEEHIRMVFDKWSNSGSAPLSNGIDVEQFEILVIDELLGEIIYEYGDILKANKIATQELNDIIEAKRTVPQEQIEKSQMLGLLLKIKKYPSPNRMKLFKLNQKLEECNKELEKFHKKLESKNSVLRRFMPSEKEEMADANARAKSGALKLQEHNKKLHEQWSQRSNQRETRRGRSRYSSSNRRSKR